MTERGDNMNFDASQKKTIWNKYFPNATGGYDVFGRYMTEDNFEADHIWPQSRGGKTVIENGIPLAEKSNQEKSDDYSGTVNDKSFEIRRREAQPGIGILYVNGNKVSK